MTVHIPRPLLQLVALAGSAVVALLVVVAVSGGAGPLVWVAVAGAAACGCGLVVGSTARVVPAMVLAILTAAALVLAVESRDDGAPQAVRTFEEVAPR